MFKRATGTKIFVTRYYLNNRLFHTVYSGAGEFSVTVEPSFFFRGSWYFNLPELGTLKTSYKSDRITIECKEEEIPQGD